MMSQGKRSLRRRENAAFVHNPHATLPSTADLSLPLQIPANTFPRPLPPCLPRSLLLPPSRPPPSVPASSTAGLFSLSLRGVRRTLRARPSAPYLVRAIETHLATWLSGGTYLNPDQSASAFCFPGDPVGDRDDIREVSRQAAQLVWIVRPASDGGFERYVVHCVARWYGLVSFSRETDGRRLTYLLRPNVSRPDPRTETALDTPPATDASDFHASDVHSTDNSDADSFAGDQVRALSDIDESRPASPLSLPDVEVEPEKSVDERGFVASMESLSLSASADDLLVPSAPRARADRHFLRTVYPRSTSSPSPARGPLHRLPTARKPGHRSRKAKGNNKVLAGAIGNKGSFYDYLFFVNDQ